ncbi:MAG: hypothetical protein GY739_09885, partial [Mesoflavibacter sp.]|nr:hypothetical protein [Mesoflavibacter sp.]
TEGIYIDAVWENQNIDISKYPVGEITTVPIPDYIVIQIEGYWVTVRQTVETIEFKEFDIKYKQHNCELAVVVTYHKMQGKTVDATILSLNSRSDVSSKIHPITITSLVVGTSRVRKAEYIRVLPMSEEDIKFLTSLQWNRYLRLFFQNFDKQTGQWKHDGLTSETDLYRKNIIIKLALIDLKQITRQEAEQFVSTKKLDIIVTTENTRPKKEDYIDALQPFHDQGRLLLLANNGALLQEERNKLLYELEQLDILS